MQINIGQENPTQQSFFFEAIPNKALQQKQLKQALTKWGLADTLKIGTFRFNQHFQEYDSKRFLLDLFNNPNVRYVQSNLKYPQGNFGSVESQKLRCQQLTLDMFDQLEKEGLVKHQYIQKCMSEYYEQIQVCDKIRECILLQESENYCVYSEAQRKQFLFKIFQMLLIGGSLNQYEDKITPYLDFTKKMYKSLVSVRKRPETSEIFVQSIVYKINSMEEGKVNVPGYNPQNFTYVVINPSIRTAHVLSNEWIKFW